MVPLELSTHSLLSDAVVLEAPPVGKCTHLVMPLALDT